MIIDVIIIIVEVQQSKSFEQMVQDRCACQTFHLVDPSLNGSNGVMYTIPFSLVSITKYDDQLRGICQGTIYFLTRQKIEGLQS